MPRGARRPGRHRLYIKRDLFHNPFAYMSTPEAMVKLQLDKLRVPYSWRFFDGDAPVVQQIIPDFAPEFTLREYRVVIVVLGGFFGTIPGVLDKTALAQVALEQDGWKMAILFQVDILRDPYQAITTALPELRHPIFTGGERANPLGAADILLERFNKRRDALRGFALHRSKFKTAGQEGTARQRRKNAISRNRRRRRRGRGLDVRTPEVRGGTPGPGY